MKYIGIAVACVAVSSSQQAFGDPGEAGQLAVGAERLTGFTHSSSSSKDDYGKTTTTYNNFHLLSNPLGGFVTAYSVPRVGLDYFVTDGLSLGGALSYAHIGTNSKAEPVGGGPSVEFDGSIDLWILAPRVGYAHMFSSQVGIWPRGGVTYIASSSEADGGGESSGSNLALSIDVPFLFAPVDNVAFAVGPTLDLGLSESSEFKDSDGDVVPDDTDDEPPTEFGVQAGITVFF